MLKWSAVDGLSQGDVPVNEVDRMTIPVGRLIGHGLRVQSIASLVLAGVLLLVGPIAAYSSIFGSLAAFIPALFFALVVAPKVGQDSAVFLRAAVMAEAAKIFLTALICVAVFVWVKPLAPGWFFTGMIVVLFSGRLALMYKA
jgi:F0F1-type ATP synthase assembly protein I